jgi:hypothetical protein
MPQRLQGEVHMEQRPVWVQRQSVSTAVAPATSLRPESLRLPRVSVLRDSFLNFFFMSTVSFR